MNIFLKLKRWQLFGLFLCIYLVFQIAGTTSVISSQGTIKQITEHNFLVFKKTSTSTSYSQEEVATAIPSLESFSSVQITKTSSMVILFIVVLFG